MNENETKTVAPQSSFLEFAIYSDKADIAHKAFAATFVTTNYGRFPKQPIPISP